MGSDHNLLPQLMWKVIAIGMVFEAQAFLDLFQYETSKSVKGTMKTSTFGGETSRFSIENLAETWLIVGKR